MALKVMYLGWPRAASSWLYRQLAKSNITAIDDQKENHLWYTNPNLAILQYNKTVGDFIVDFSTNNWSMDLNIAKNVAELFDYFILVHREPKQMVSSYYQINQTVDWENWQNTCLYNNLCNTGDTLERWQNIVGDKLKIYEYKNLCSDQQLFLNTVCKDIGIQSIEIDSFQDNKSPLPHLEISNHKLKSLITEQENKFYSLLSKK